ncbi:MAG: hypothetical protein IRY97_00995 [Thermomicrobiaceae bacterium]|nr:hypothetical protein [Thermomicrobiaceae bacterium]
MAAPVRKADVEHIESTDPAELEQRRDALYRRLEHGYERIEQALREGQDVTRWEEFWIALLDEYERICDELDALPGA